MTKWISVAFVALAFSAHAQSVQPYPAPAKRPALTDAQVALKIVAMSRAQYAGPCGCPDDVDRAGRSCGRRSAYSRPGGKYVYCYPHDVTQGMIADYRAGRLTLSR
jgi:hypothetical protein